MELKALSPSVDNQNELDSRPLPVSTGLSNPYIPLATSDNTRKAYRSDIKHYENWGGKLPATAEMIANYLHDYAAILNPRTLARRLIALRHWHSYQGFADPTLHPGIQKTLTGIMRAHGKPKQKARALTLEELTRIHQHLRTQNTLSALRDDALLQIGFFGAFRRSELVAIHIEHIQWLKDGIHILIPSSKTDQTHEGQICFIPHGNEILCPVHVLKQWLSLSRLTHGPLFRRLTLSGQMGENALTPLAVNHIIKNRAHGAKINEVEKFSGHSLRRGFATAAAKAHVPLHNLMRDCRWKNPHTAMEYIEANEKLEESSAGKIINSIKVETKNR